MQSERSKRLKAKLARERAQERARHNGQVAASVGREHCCFEHGTGVRIVHARIIKVLFLSYSVLCLAETMLLARKKENTRDSEKVHSNAA